MSEISWSKEQLDVINSIKDNTLVSASAGSGKTAVMIERLIRIIVNGTPINEIVMVTFNNSVAQELRLKISKALKKQLENASSIKEKEYLREQIEMVPMANISTLHSLCTTIIRENFEIVKIDPSFSIIDEESAAVLFDTAVNEVFKNYEREYDQDFEMLYKYLTRNGFKDVIKILYDFIVAQPDREEYLDKIQTYSTIRNLNKKPILIKYFQMMKDECYEWKDKYEYFCHEFIRIGMNKEKFIDKHALISIETIEKILMTKNIEEMLNVSLETSIPNTPTLINEEKDNIDCIEIHEEYKVFNARVRETLKELKNLASINFKTHEEISQRTYPYIKKICEFVGDVIDAYAIHKFEENKLDFADLEYNAVKILKNDEIANEYKNKFKYVCVDEYQDINDVQEFILNKISNDNNLFMVGDSKQSIYGFRQTDTNIFLNKLKEYKNNTNNGKAFYLNANYRSEECILKFVNEIFDEIMTEPFCGVDYKNEARLVYGQKNYTQLSSNPIEVTICQKRKVEKTDEPDGPFYPDNWVYSIEEDNRIYDKTIIDEESLYVVNKIKELVGKQEICFIEDGKPVNRTIEYKDIAILCAKRNDAKNVIKAFEQYNIPADTTDMEIEDTSQEINVLIEILKAIDNPNQDYSLIAAMTSFVGNFSMNDLVEIREATYCKVEDSVEVGKDGKRRTIYFYEYVYEISKGDSELSCKTKDFLEKLDRYRIIASFSKVSDLLKRIVYENYFSDIILMKKDGKQRLNQVITYIDSLKDKYYNNALGEYIKFIDEVPKLKTSISKTSIDSNSVIMSTLHKSKGLEYPVVFYIGACNSFDSRGSKASNTKKILLDKDYGMTMPTLDEDDLYFEDGLMYHAMGKYKKSQELKEKMRLMYVGLTRAKNMLFISGTGEPKEIIRAADAKSFMEWIVFASKKNLDIKRKYFNKNISQLEEITQEKKQTIKFGIPSDKEFKEFMIGLNPTYKYKDSRTLEVKHTVTSLNKANVDLVQSYGDINYLNEKTKGVSSAAVGTAMHRALQLIDFDLYTLEDVKLALDQMVIDDKMLKEERNLIDDELIFKCLQSSIIEEARKATCHYREKLFILNINANELFKDINTKDKVMLEGVIDLLIKKPEGYIVVDYKHSHKSDSLLKAAYKTQLDLYASAIRATTGAKVIGEKILVIDDGRVVNIE